MFLRIRQMRSLATCSLGLLAIVALSVEVSAQEQEVTIAGMVVGIDENDDGEFERVYIQDDNLGQILVVDDANGKKLLELAGSQVEATGLLEDGATALDEFGMQIHIKTYRPID